MSDLGEGGAAFLCDGVKLAPIFRLNKTAAVLDSVSAFGFFQQANQWGVSVCGGDDEGALLFTFCLCRAVGHAGGATSGGTNNRHGPIAITGDMLRPAINTEGVRRLG